MNSECKPAFCWSPFAALVYRKWIAVEHGPSSWMTSWLIKLSQYRNGITVCFAISTHSISGLISGHYSIRQPLPSPSASCDSLCAYPISPAAVTDPCIINFLANEIWQTTNQGWREISWHQLTHSFVEDHALYLIGPLVKSKYIDYTACSGKVIWNGLIGIAGSEWF